MKTLSDPLRQCTAAVPTPDRVQVATGACAALGSALAGFLLSSVMVGVAVSAVFFVAAAYLITQRYAEMRSRGVSLSVYADAVLLQKVRGAAMRLSFVELRAVRFDAARGELVLIARTGTVTTLGPAQTAGLDQDLALLIDDAMARTISVTPVSGLSSETRPVSGAPRSVRQAG
jgi:hypothetical protein